MASGSQLRATIASKLSALNATPRLVKFRTTTRVGGNSRLGLGGTVTATDVTADPQPAAQMMRSEDLANTAGSLIQPGDWEFTFAGTLAEEVLRQSQILFGDTEVLNIVQYEPYALNGIVCAWRVIGRTAQTR
jgi:hypothetical protein